MADDLVVGDLIIPGEEIEERFDTPGGPGGQHANRTASAVTLRFDITANTSLPQDVRDRLIDRLGNVIEVRAADSRSQHTNRRIARERLTERLETGARPSKSRRKTKPSSASRERRLSIKRARSDVKRSRQRPDDDI